MNSKAQIFFVFLLTLALEVAHPWTAFSDDDSSAQNLSSGRSQGTNYDEGFQDNEKIQSTTHGVCKTNPSMAGPSYVISPTNLTGHTYQILPVLPALPVLPTLMDLLPNEIIPSDKSYWSKEPIWSYRPGWSSQPDWSQQPIWSYQPGWSYLRNWSTRSNQPIWSYQPNRSYQSNYPNEPDSSYQPGSSYQPDQFNLPNRSYHLDWYNKQ